MRTTKRLSMVFFLLAVIVSAPRDTAALAGCMMMQFHCPIIEEWDDGNGSMIYECYGAIDCEDHVQPCVEEWCGGAQYVFSNNCLQEGSQFGGPGGIGACTSH